MYIPTTFMSSQGACMSASVSTISGSGLITSGTFQSGSTIWQYYKFETSDFTNPSLSAFTASLNILSGSTGQAKILIVGGGGTSAAVGTISDGSISSWAVNTSGGGAGGGVVYYNTFPLYSGSFEIGIANATSGTQLCDYTNTGQLCGKVGKTSYVKLPNNINYTPFTSSYLTAYGGGGGSVQGWFYLVSPHRDYYRSFFINGAVFASAGGASGAEGKSSGNSSNTVAGAQGLGGLNGANQGQNGGAWQGGDPNNGYTNGGGPGGGGAGTAAANLGSDTGNFNKVTNGGDGLTFNLTGTNLIVSNGGGGYNSINPAVTGQRGSSNADTYGSGGNGNGGGVGNGGVVIIAWPICLNDSNNCKLYTISSGASGGTMTYIPCDTQTVTTTTIDFGFTGSACLYNIAGYPTVTGTVSLTPVGNCDNFIPIPPYTPCSGNTPTPLYLWNWATTSQCYPTPTSCQRLYYNSTTFYYTDYLGNSVTGSFGGGFGGGSGQFCARDIPTPTITRGTVTKTATVCAYYCSGSTTTTTTTTATPINYVSGSYLIYDVGNPSSYSGSGTTIYDVSGNNRNGTLVNSPTYNAANSGYLSFNGTNQRITYSGKFNSAFTVQMIWRQPTTVYQTYPGIASQLNNNGINLGIDTGYTNLSGIYAQMFYGASGNTDTGAFIDANANIDIRNKFTMFTFNSNGIDNHKYYVNATLNTTNTSTRDRTLYTPTNQTAYLAFNALNNQYQKGDLIAYLVYDRVLTNAEITQNYNIFASRY